MSVTTYAPGSQVRITGTFTNLLTNVIGDPTTVTLYLKKPGGNPVIYTAPGGGSANGIVFDSVGNYHYDLILDTPGVWLRAWAGSGVIVAAEEDLEIHVSNSQLH